jgi:hypothetical protein
MSKIRHTPARSRRSDEIARKAALVIAGMVCSLLLSGAAAQQTPGISPLGSPSVQAETPPEKKCGPPSYPCSRTDFAIIQVPNPVPNVGNLVGANTIITDPDFHNPIVRVTDANTNPRKPARSFGAGIGGSADVTVWNKDSTLFILGDTGGEYYPFSFDPDKMQAARLYKGSFPASGGIVTREGVWSHSQPNVLYMLDHATILKLDFSDRKNPPKGQVIVDFAKFSDCMPVGFKATWYVFGGVSEDESIFSAAFSSSGQDTGAYAVVYQKGKGCRLLNTQTGQVTGSWGSSGTITTDDRWGIHNVKLSKDGSWLVVSNGKCYSSNCAGPYFWQVNSTTTSNCAKGTSCGGHWTAGHNRWINAGGAPMGQLQTRLFSSTRSPTALIKGLPLGITPPFDVHLSWSNVDPNDSFPVLSATRSITAPFPGPWYNEVIGIAADGSGKVWRFAHTFNTAKSHRFAPQQAIGSVSQDGRFFVFSSDWMGTLGSESGAHTCTIGKDCRGDVFVVELQ